MFGKSGGGSANGEVVVGDYEEDHAVFMLASMFNQFPLARVTKTLSTCKGDFGLAVEALLLEQKREGSKPRKHVKFVTQQARVEIDISPPVKKQTHTFRALNDSFDFSSVVKWKTFDLQNERHLRLLKGTCDPISLEDLLEMGMTGKDQIIQLPCATKKLRCNFTRTSAIECLRARPECPVCKTQYPIPGKQPSGKMSVRFIKNQDCSGYLGDGSIDIRFEFPAGIQGKNHPNPGRHYAGTNRNAVLPHVEEGKEALLLLIKAFKRGELFNIGKSLTSGAEDQITYSSIHLKTSYTGGATNHGWPDNTYFNRLKAECAAKMIFDDSVQKEMTGARSKGTTKKII